MMNETLVKYLAGLLDADGSLSFNFRRRGPDKSTCSLRMTLVSSTEVDRQGFVESLPGLTGMGTVCVDGRNEKFRAWTVAKRADLEMLLPRLTKHMVIKARHWDWLLKTWRSLRSNGNAVSDTEADDLKVEAKLSRRTRSGPLAPKNHPTWAWVSGYLDGDGWFSFRREKSGRTTVNVGAVAHLNDIQVLEFLHNAFGGHLYVHGKAAGVFIWRRSLGAANRSFALRFLPRVARHSRLKKHKIERIIHHHRQRLSDQRATA